MNKDSKAYWRALIGTFLLCVMMGLGIGLMWFNKSWSYLWIIGCLNVSAVYTIILILAKSYIKNSQKEQNGN